MANANNFTILRIRIEIRDLLVDMIYIRVCASILSRPSPVPFARTSNRPPKTGEPNPGAWHGHRSLPEASCRPAGNGAIGPGSPSSTCRLSCPPLQVFFWGPSFWNPLLEGTKKRSCASSKTTPHSLNRGSYAKCSAF